jgi:Fe-S-cluster-containing hydrogenase component 2
MFPDTSSARILSLKEELRETAQSMGATDARVATKEMLEGPPSGDPAYVFPDARTVVSFAIPLGTDYIEDYLGKKTRMVFKRVLYEKYQLVGAVADAISGRIKQMGFRAESPAPNAVFRSNAEGSQGPSFLVPDFSHLYAAVASGIGSFGWSGNVLVEGHWSNVFLGSVITEAPLPPDQPLADRLCDGCKICARVCPLEFIQSAQSQTLTLGGRTYEYNAKGNHMRCGLACGGFNGRSRDGKWSSWSFLDYGFPETDQDVLAQFARGLTDPNAEMAIRANGYDPKTYKKAKWVDAAENRKRGILYRSYEDTYPTCNHCMMVCSGPIERRKELLQLLHSSGVVVRLADGTETAVKP